VRGNEEQVTYHDWLRAQVEAEEYWFQTIDLGDGLTTPGWSNPMTEKLPFYGLPDDMTGMRVLDIGCCEGFFSFEAERRGAADVVAIDSFPESIRRFNICRNALGSKANGYLASVYDLDPKNFGTFDLVMYFGVLYHLRHPLLSLQKIAGVTAGTVILQTRSFEAPGLGEISAARFNPFGIESGTAEDPTQDLSVIWEPNAACVRDMLLHVGFVNVERVYSSAQPEPVPPPNPTKPNTAAKPSKLKVYASRALPRRGKLTPAPAPAPKALANVSMAIFCGEAPVRSAGVAPPEPQESGTDGRFSGASRL
jgi:tRNA (mo5U34)-methyltransferase